MTESGFNKPKGGLSLTSYPHGLCNVVPEIFMESRTKTAMFIKTKHDSIWIRLIAPEIHYTLHRVLKAIFHCARAWIIVLRLLHGLIVERNWRPVPYVKICDKVSDFFISYLNLILFSAYFIKCSHGRKTILKSSWSPRYLCKVLKHRDCISWSPQRSSS